MSIVRPDTSSNADCHDSAEIPASLSMYETSKPLPIAAATSGGNGWDKANNLCRGCLLARHDPGLITKRTGLLLGKARQKRNLISELQPDRQLNSRMSGKPSPWEEAGQKPKYHKLLDVGRVLACCALRQQPEAHSALCPAWTRT